jgi:hypothetical protein
VWTSRIDEMKIYSKEELAKLLSNSGFSAADSQTNKSGWLCVTAIKRGQGDVTEGNGV